MLRTELARARFRADDFAGGSKFVREILKASSASPTSRYSFYFERAVGARVALLESVAAGEWSDAWDALGQWLDSIGIGFESGFPAQDFERMAAELAGRPPARAIRFHQGMDFPERRAEDTQAWCRSSVR